MDLNKSFLLPHKWQIVGGWLIIAAIILAVVLIMCDINGYNGNVRALMAWVPVYIGLMLICLSKEKNDDEYIRCLRSRLVGIFVAIAFAFEILDLIFKICFINYGRTSVGGNVTRIILYFFSYPLLYAIAYIICLKLNLWIINRKMKKNAE